MYLFLSFSDPTRERWMFWFGSCASSEAACLCRNLTSCLLLFPPRRLLWFPLIYSAVKTLLSLRRWRAGKEVTRRLSCGWRRAKTIRILPSYHVLIAERGWMCCDVAAHFVPFFVLISSPSTWVLSDRRRLSVVEWLTDPRSSAGLTLKSPFTTSPVTKSLEVSYLTVAKHYWLK